MQHAPYAYYLHTITVLIFVAIISIQGVIIIIVNSLASSRQPNRIRAGSEDRGHWGLLYLDTRQWWFYNKCSWTNFNIQIIISNGALGRPTIANDVWAQVFFVLFCRILINYHRYTAVSVRQAVTAAGTAWRQSETGRQNVNNNIPTLCARLFAVIRDLYIFFFGFCFFFFLFTRPPRAIDIIILSSSSVLIKWTRVSTALVWCRVHCGGDASRIVILFSFFLFSFFCVFFSLFAFCFPIHVMYSMYVFRSSPPAAITGVCRWQLDGATRREQCARDIDHACIRVHNVTISTSDGKKNNNHNYNLYTYANTGRTEGIR